MKIIEAKINGNEKLAVDTLRHIERRVCEHGDSVADGWRCIIEMQLDGENTAPYFRLDVQSNRGGGDYAEAKMTTLFFDKSMAATGLETPTAFAERVKHGSMLAIPYGEDSKQNCEKNDGRLEFEHNLDRIRKLDYIEQIPKDVAEYLREFQITSYKGAIRVPYDRLMVAEGKADFENEKGEIRISFSGAEEWQDLYFATSILGCIQQVLLSEQTYSQIWFNLRGLQSNPQTNMWLKLLKIEEAPEH